jgi:hypothetical protein
MATTSGISAKRHQKRWLKKAPAHSRLQVEAHDGNHLCHRGDMGDDLVFRFGPQGRHAHQSGVVAE